MNRSAQVKLTVPFLLAGLATGLAAQGSLSVVSVSPTRNQVTASTAAPVVLTFNAAVNASTATAANVKVLGRWSGPVPGTISVQGSVLTFRPSRPYFPSENVNVYVTHNLASTAGALLPGGFTSTFWARPAPGSASFNLVQTINLRLPGEGLIRTYGIFAGDVDRDGSPDITAPNEVSHDVRLMKNDGCGTFGAMTIVSDPGQEPSPSESSDFNGDGWLDLVTGNQTSANVSVYLNNQAGGYLPPVHYATGGFTHGVAVLDADADGDFDIVAPNGTMVALFLNNGNGTFATPPILFNGGGNGEDNIGVADANNDGLPDIFSGNLSSSNVGLLLGNGTGVFTLSATQPCGGAPFQMAVGDVDLDGNVDCVTANQGSNTMGIVRGNGAGGLLPATTYPVGSGPAAIDLGDLDGDGDLDVCVSNYGSANYTVYRNNGNGTFTLLVTLPSTSAGSCVTIVDYDRDGDADIIATDELADEARLYSQAGPSPAGTQAPSCTATLRVNNWANRAGFGGAPPEAVSVGRLLFLGLTGAATMPYAVAAGVAQTPGASFPFGVLNLNLSLAPFLVVNGFAGGPGGMTNAAGEAQESFFVPAGTPTGGIATLQALCADTGAASGFRLSNPQTIILVP